MANLSNEQKSLYNDLSILEKIAIFLIQMGEEPSTLIFSNLDTDMVIEITKHIANARSVDRAVATAVLEEFHTLLKTNQYIKNGSLEFAKEILYNTYGIEEAEKILSKLAKTLDGNQAFSYLGNIKPQQLADFIVNEYPQTIALIIAHMEPTRAAETLEFFEDDLRSEVIHRIATLGDISPSIIKRVSTVLESKLQSLTSYKVEVGGTRAVAEVLNRLGQKSSKSTIAYLEQADEKLATTIKDMMFTFDDITKLGNTAIREILKVADKKDLMVALKGSTEDLKNMFLSNMSQRAAEGFNEEMGFLGAVRVKDVEEAQRKIVEVVQKLNESGVIQLGESDEMIE